MSRWGEAAQHFEDAIAMNATMGARPFVAHAQHEYARMLLARAGPGDQERAQQLLRRASDTADRCGMTRLAERVKSVISHSSIRPDGLTSREVGACKYAR